MVRSSVTIRGWALAIAACAALGACKKSDDDPAPDTSWPVVYSDTGGGSGVVRQNPADSTQRSIAGTFLGSYTIQSTYTWYIDAPTIFGNDSGSVSPTLTVQAGTTLYGRGGTPPSMLVIKRNANISAIGTAGSPIVFTSAQPVGSRAPGDWGGIVINGWAQVNEGSASAPPQGEGNTGPYGGFASDGSLNNADNSGTLQYVRVEYAGHVFTSTDELNGIAFQGVGSGTTVDHVQVHQASDDGIEFFGGTVNCTYLVVTGAQDDSLDWTFGYSGKIQFVVIQQYAGGADSGHECDNNGSNNTATPLAIPTLSNVTIVGPAGTTAAGGRGIHFKAGTGGKLWNYIVTDVQGAGVDIDGTATYNLAYSDSPTTYNTLSGNLFIQNSIFYANPNDFDPDTGEPQTESQWNTHIGAQLTAGNILTGTTQLVANALNQTTPDFRAANSTVAAMTTGWADPDSTDAFWTTVTYIGAMDDTTNWANGWTTASQN